MPQGRGVGVGAARGRVTLVSPKGKGCAQLLAVPERLAEGGHWPFGPQKVL